MKTNKKKQNKTKEIPETLLLQIKQKIISSRETNNLLFFFLQEKRKEKKRITEKIEENNRETQTYFNNLHEDFKNNGGNDSVLRNAISLLLKELSESEEKTEP